MMYYLIALVVVSGLSAQRELRLEALSFKGTEGIPESNYLLKAVNFLWQANKSGYHHVWPVFFIFNFHCFSFIPSLFYFPPFKVLFDLNYITLDSSIYIHMLINDQVVLVVCLNFCN